MGDHIMDNEELRAKIAEDMEGLNDALEQAKVEEEDSLERIFRLQKSFDVTVQEYPPFSNYSQEKKVTALLGHLIHESYETRNELGTVITGDTKWWKNEVLDKTKWGKVHEELIDCVHFLVSAMLNAGMTYKDVLDEYEKKNEINHIRQERGY